MKGRPIGRPRCAALYGGAVTAPPQDSACSRLCPYPHSPV